MAPRRNAQGGGQPPRIRTNLLLHGRPDGRYLTGRAAVADLEFSSDGTLYFTFPR